MTEATTTAVGFTAVRDGRILRLTFSRPERMNAVDYDTMVALGNALIEAASDPGVRVVVLSGAGGRAFTTGADLSTSGAEAARGITSGMVMDAANRMIKAIVELPVPVIAKVTGAAAGVGASIAIAADLTYATEKSYLLLAFINIGLMPDGGASALVAAAAGRARAAEMALLGGRLPAMEAVAAGLITAVVADDEINERVEAAAQKLAFGPRRALELTKQAINGATLASLDEVLAREKAGQMELLQSPDFFEGARAMLTKSKANFAS